MSVLYIIRKNFIRLVNERPSFLASCSSLRNSTLPNYGYLHNTLLKYNSTIFKTINDEVGQTKVVLNDTVKSLFNGSLFKKESLLSQSDISALQAYNAELERGVSPMTAYYKTMQNASDAAVNMASSANGATVSISKIPKV